MLDIKFLSNAINHFTIALDNLLKMRNLLLQFFDIFGESADSLINFLIIFSSELSKIIDKFLVALLIIHINNN